MIRRFDPYARGESGRHFQLRRPVLRPCGQRAVGPASPGQARRQSGPFCVSSSTFRCRPEVDGTVLCECVHLTADVLQAHRAVLRPERAAPAEFADRDRTVVRAQVRARARRGLDDVEDDRVVVRGARRRNGPAVGGRVHRVQLRARVPPGATALHVITV